MKKDKKVKNQVEEPVVLDIPEDEIWTYQIEGLAAPHINKPYKFFTLKKIIFTITIIIAVSLSVYFSIRTVQKETFEYESASQGTYQLSNFSNTGYITELDIDYVTEVIYDQDNKNPETNFELVKDETKKITEVRQYALNGDGVVKVINIGKDVEKIDGKSFYSCWALERIEVDEENPYYCDIDGVLYNKNKTVLINYPCNHDNYLREKYGYETEPYREEADEKYVKEIQTYVVPSTVKELGELCFSYVNLRNIYLPEGLEAIGSLAVFKLHEPKDQYSNIASLDNIYSYKTEKTVKNTVFTSEEKLGEVYLSLPEGLKIIDSDAFSYNQALTYMYIPESVTFIGHHAFWDTVYKEDGELKGVAQINVALSEEEFEEKVEQGDQWKPQYDYLLFKKSIDTVCSSERKAK
ncbi:MAG: leucine-rich repeat protein [Clostridia bacterium]|nr:leucine-rich repeat protein [Clostridia bacterium]